MLLDHGASIDLPSSEGTRPLWTAIVNDHAEVARRLVERGADVNTPLSSFGGGSDIGSGFTPLHGAAHRNHARLAHVLIERGADVNKEDDTHHTPLQLAAIMGNAAAAEVILWHRPNSASFPGTLLDRTPLFLASLWNAYEVAKLLIDYGADVEVVSDSRTIQATPLRAAAQGNHERMVDLLLKRGRSNPNAKAADGSTCLHVAVSNGADRIAALLIAAGANVDAQLASAGETPLHLACRRRRRNHHNHNNANSVGLDGASMKSTLDDRMSPSISSSVAGTPAPMSSASSSTGTNSTTAPQQSGADSLTLVRLLLSANANVHISEERAGLTPLHIASREGDVAVVTLLLDHGAQMEAMTHTGFAPLAIAALNGRAEVVRVLLDRGANPFAVSFDGVSVMHAAVMGVVGGEVSARCIALLLEKGAAVDPLDQKGDTPLAIASRAGNLFAVRVLVAAGANLEHLAWPTTGPATNG
jgi:ankyrin